MILGKWSRGRAWLGNPVVSHSGRTAVAAVGSLLVARSFGLPEAYWATVATLMVLQSSVGEAMLAARRRFTGAALGATLGGVLGTFLRPSVALFGAGILVLGWVCAALPRAQKDQPDPIDQATYRYAGVTLAVVMLIPRPLTAWVVALHRFLEVSIGIAVALVLTVVWPEKGGRD
jgi:uncharacterized membrane protein YccC